MTVTTDYKCNYVWMNAECRLAAFMNGTHGRALGATIHSPNHPW